MYQGLIFCFLLLAGNAWGCSMKFSQVSSAASEEPTLTSHDHSKEKIIVTDDKTERIPDNYLKQDKIFNEKFHTIKDFDFSDMIESLFPTIFHEDDMVKKKPKVKTVVSLTEFISPKHHPDPFMSPFGMKESSLIDDPFFDIPKLMSFMPKFSKIDLVWPMKNSKGKEKSSETTNLTDVEYSSFPWHHHHTAKRDMKIDSLKFPELIKDDKNTGPNVFIKEPRIMSLNEVKLEEATISNPNDEIVLEKAKDRMNCLAKSLPYIEGAIGGVMFVMLVLLVATWRIKKPGPTWATIPFVDESQYGEKI